jgi:multiple sugar transport system ATP-binding protein
MTAISLRDVSMSFDKGDFGLSDIDMEIHSGEFVVIAGPSGSGKTTLLRIIAGLERPATGTVAFDDRDVTELKAEARNLSMVFQDYALYPLRNAEGNIMFPLETRGVKPASERKRRAQDEARHLRIEHILHKMPGELSAGHQQAVATARALVRESEALLMDEPLAHLDAKMRGQARVELKRVHRELGVTIVYVTNDQVEAMALGDRMALLDHGEVQQFDEPRRVYDRPANTMVAGFLGSPPMNLLPAELEATEGGADLLVGTDRIRLDAAALASSPALPTWFGRPVTVGIRPEWLRPAGPGVPFERTLHGKVSRTEDHGSEHIVDVSLGLPGVDALVRLGAAAAVQPGDPVELEITLNRLVFFDPASGFSI